MARKLLFATLIALVTFASATLSRAQGDFPSALSFGRAKVSLKASGPKITPLYADTTVSWDFENGAPGWELEGEWEVGQPSACSPHQGQNVLATDLDGNYENNASWRAKTPWILLGKSPTLRFWHWGDLENGYDYAKLVVITEDGTEHLIKRWTGSWDWKEETVSLAPFAKRLVKIAFVLESDHSITYSGWYMDEVKVADVQPFWSFEDGAPDWALEGEWEVGYPLPCLPYDGQKVLATDLDGFYENNAYWFAKTPWISLGESPVLEFRSWTDLEIGCDWGGVAITTDGYNWTFLARYSGQGNWDREVINLESYANQQVEIAFVLCSNTSVSGWGWYLDNVCIRDISGDSIPSVQILSPSPGVYTDSVNIRWTASDADDPYLDIKIYYNREGSQWWFKVASLEGQPTGQGNYVWDVGGLEPGNYRIMVGAIDPEGAEGRAVSGWITIGHAPEITLLAPATGAYSNNIEVKWRVEDDSSQVSFCVCYKEESEAFWHEIASGTCSTGTICSYTWNISGLPKGRYRVKVHVVDSMDLEGEAVSGVLVINDEAPSVEILEPAKDAIYGDETPIRWKATDSDDSQLYVEIYYAPSGSRNWTRIAAGTYPVGENSIHWNTKDVPKGRYRIKLKARDSLGLTALATSECFWVDRTPSVRILEPSEGAIYEDSVGIAWETSDRDDATLSVTISYRKEGESWKEIKEMKCPVGESSFTWTPGNLPKGRYQVKIEVRDSVGACASAESQPFWIEDIPSAEILSPTPGTCYRDAVPIEWEVSDSDDATVELAILYRKEGETPWDTVAEMVVPPGTGAYTWNVGGLEDGHYRIKLVARDGVGATFEALSGVFAIGYPPSVEILSPTPAAYKGTVNIRWKTYDENDSQLTLRIYWRAAGDGTWNRIAEATYPVGEQTYAWDASYLEPNKYAIKVEAVDHAGLVGEATSQWFWVGECPFIVPSSAEIWANSTLGKATTVSWNVESYGEWLARAFALSPVGGRLQIADWGSQTAVTFTVSSEGGWDEEGRWKIVVEAKDLALGTSSSKEVATVVVDNTGPWVKVLSEKLEGPGLLLRWTMGDNLAKKERLVPTVYVRRPGEDMWEKIIELEAGETSVKLAEHGMGAYAKSYVVGVTVRDPAGNEASATKELEVWWQPEMLRVYPNPLEAGHVLRIRVALEAPAEVLKVGVYRLSGELVYLDVEKDLGEGLFEVCWTVPEHLRSEVLVVVAFVRFEGGGIRVAKRRVFVAGGR